MPRAHIESTEPHYQQAIYALKSDVTRKGGFEVRTVKECKILSKEVEAFDRRFPLAISTFRRFFGLIPSESKFSITTLNTLARFAGKNSFRYYLDLAKAESLRNQDRLSTEAHVHQTDILPQKLGPLLDLLEMAPYATLGFDFMQQLAIVTAQSYIDEHAMTSSMIQRLTQSTRLRAVVLERYPPMEVLSPKAPGAEIMEAYLRRANHTQERLFAIGLLAQGALFAGELGLAQRWLNPTWALPKLSDRPTDLHLWGRVTALRWLLSLWNRDDQNLQSNTADMLRLLPPSDRTEFPAFAATAARFVIISGNRQMIASTKQSIKMAMDQPELALQASHAIHALRLELAWLDYLMGDDVKARTELNLLSEDSFVNYDKGVSLIFWYTLLGHTSLDQEARHLHFNRAEHWAQKCNYPGLHGQLLLAAPALTEERHTSPVAQN